MVSVIIPEEIDQIYINNTPIQLGDKKGIGCHGCSMNLQYYSIIPKIIQEVEWGKDSFFVEIITDSGIEKFNFEQSLKSLSFQVNEENKFITTIIPLELLGGPYVVFLDDEQILFHKSMNGETHTTLDFIPKTTGEITITGTTTEMTTTEMTTTVEPIDSSPESNYLIYAIVGGIVASVIIATIIRVKQKTTKLTQNQQTTPIEQIDTEEIFKLKPDIREDDKEIVKFISNNGGKALESELRKKFLQPRTTMWRAVKRLERNGIIEIEKKDLQNLVKLRKNMEEEE